MCASVCVHAFVFMCLLSVCGDSCSLNSIIVSNWGLPSQCVVVKCILSQLPTVHTYADVKEPENRRESGCRCEGMGGKTLLKVAK